MLSLDEPATKRFPMLLFCVASWHCTIRRWCCDSCPCWAGCWRDAHTYAQESSGTEITSWCLRMSLLCWRCYSHWFSWILRWQFANKLCIQVQQLNNVFVCFQASSLNLCLEAFFDFMKVPSFQLKRAWSCECTLFPLLESLFREQEVSRHSQPVLRVSGSICSAQQGEGSWNSLQEFGSLKVRRYKQAKQNFQLASSPGSPFYFFALGGPGARKYWMWHQIWSPWVCPWNHLPSSWHSLWPSSSAK